MFQVLATRRFIPLVVEADAEAVAEVVVNAEVEFAVEVAEVVMAPKKKHLLPPMLLCTIPVTISS